MSYFEKMTEIVLRNKQTASKYSIFCQIIKKNLAPCEKTLHQKKLFNS